MLSKRCFRENYWHAGMLLYEDSLLWEKAVTTFWSYPQLNKCYSALLTTEKKKGCSSNISYCKMTVGETAEHERGNLDSNLPYSKYGKECLYLRWDELTYSHFFSDHRSRKGIKGSPYSLSFSGINCIQISILQFLNSSPLRLEAASYQKTHTTLDKCRTLFFLVFISLRKK